MGSLSVEAPDPKTFKSWEDAFKYPVPAVRRLQQQLRGDISGNRERLRTLVGTSYRDLLGTADSIIQMDKQMQEVEIHLGDTSRKCNTTLMDKSFANSLKLTSSGRSADRIQFARASQLSVFRKCPEALVRILRKGGSVLLAAKVLIISRLLHKKLAEDPRASTYVNTIWTRLGRLRQKLLATIDKRLANPTLETAGLIDALCAYSLATSTSSSIEILRHFHHVRQEALLSRRQQETPDHTNVLNSLRIWVRTLQDTRSVFPKQVAGALAKLRSAPILMDKEIQAITAFEFDVHQTWLGDDVQNFIPYFRRDGRDDLQVTEASKQLATWAPSALKTLFHQLKGYLDSIDDLQAIISVRKACLELLFSHYHVAGARKNAVLNGFREAFEDRLLEIISSRCRDISGINDDLVKLLEDWDAHRSQESRRFLWDTSIFSMNVSHGGKAITNTLQDTINGRTKAVGIVAEHYQSWRTKIEEIERLIAGMKDTRWEDHLDDLSSDSESDSESEETTSSKIKILLKERDPASLQDFLSSELSYALQGFRGAIDSTFSSLKNDSNAQAKGVFLLRALREIKQHIPHAYTGATVEFRCVPILQATISFPAVDAIVFKHQNSILKSLKQKSPSGRGVWDGSPELPVLPSPWAFRLLKSLEHELVAVGTDAWTPSARHEMKTVLRNRLAECYHATMEACSTPVTANWLTARTKPVTTLTNEKFPEKNGEPVNGKADGEYAPEKNVAEIPGKDTATQHLFDVEFLDGAPRGDANGQRHEKLDEYRSWLKQTSDLSPDLLERIVSGAIEYRKRTALLFALVN